MDKKNTKSILTAVIKIFAVLSIAFCGFFFCACTNGGEIVAVELKEGVETQVVMGQFDYDDFVFVVTYRNGQTEEVTLTNDMVLDEDKLKFFQEGEQTVRWRYKHKKISFDITVVRNEFSDLKLQSKSLVYDGVPHSLEVEGELPNGAVVSYPNGNTQTNVGTFDVVAKVSCENYKTLTLNAQLTITKADCDMSYVKFEDAEFVYDGEPKSISVTGALPKGIDVSYTIGSTKTNEAIYAGTYVVVAHFEMSGSNYNPIPDRSAVMTINKAQYDMSQYEMLDHYYTYDGMPHSILLTNESNLPDSVSVKYENNAQINAGEYEVIAHFSCNTINYEQPKDMSSTLYIYQAELVLSGVYMDAESFAYDGNEHALSYKGTLPQDVVLKEYINNNKTNVGNYEVTAVFMHTNEKNHTLATLKATLMITKGVIQNLTFSNNHFNYDKCGHGIYVQNVPSGVSVSYEGNGKVDVGEYAVTATFTMSEELLQNYEQIQPLTGVMYIDPIQYTPIFESGAFDYDGNSHSLVAEIGNDVYLQNWLTISYNNNSYVYPGDYTANAVFTLRDDLQEGDKYYTVPDAFGNMINYEEYYEKYYNVKDSLNATLTINKMIFTPQFSQRFFKRAGDWEWGFTPGYVHVTNLPSGMTANYTNNHYEYNEGYFIGSVSFTMDEECAQMYIQPESREFSYAVLEYSPVDWYQNKYVIEYKKSYVYDGLPHRIKLVLPLGLEVEILTSPSEYVEPGQYDIDIQIHATDDDNGAVARQFFDTSRFRFDTTLYINPIELELTPKCEFDYDGELHQIEFENLPSWVVPHFSGIPEEGVLLPGTYKNIIVTFEITDKEKARYYNVEPMTLTLVINKINFPYVLTDKVVVYYEGMEPQFITVDGLPEGVTYTTLGDGKNQVGEYKVYVTFVLSEVAKLIYNEPAVQCVMLIIKEATQ